MKKYHLLFVLLFLLCACTKNEIEKVQNHENFAYPIHSDIKAVSGKIYAMGVKTGHSGSKCNGCFTAGGLQRHADCMGMGSECGKKASLSLVANKVNDTYNATTLDRYELTSEDFFFMPDRSLFVELIGGKEELWLNIPEQVVLLDSITKQFTFTGLFYSNYPAYKNQ